MHFLRPLLFIIFASTFCLQPAKAVTFGICIKNFLVRFKPDTPVSDAIEPMNEYVRRWVNLVKQNRHMQFSKKTGETIRFKDLNYEIVARLGVGSEGEVYVIHTNAGLSTAKVFYETPKMVSNLTGNNLQNNVENLAERADEENLSAPTLEGIDYENRTIVYDYLDGIPVDQIKTYWKRLGLSEEFKNDIVNHSYLVADANMVYSFKYKKIFLIDPY